MPPALPLAMDAKTDKDLPLKEDTRLLGRLLGDVLRAQTGEDGFARVEAIRQTAVRLRRAGADDGAGIEAQFALLLNDLPIAQTLDVVRAFSYFSLLANLAEDVHQNRRRRAKPWPDRRRSRAAWRTPSTGCARRASRAPPCALFLPTPW
jgi:phosphoenolpyruvate carboxylase